MNKKLEKSIAKIINTVEKIMLEKNTPLYSHMETRTPLPVRVFSFGGYDKIEHNFPQVIRDHLEGATSHPILIDLQYHKAKRSSLIRFLYQENIEGKLLADVYNATLNPYSGSCHAEHIGMATKLDTDFGKKISLLVMEHCSHHLFSPFSDFNARDIITKAIDFKYGENDYPSIKKFLTHYQSVIKHQKFQFDTLLPEFIKKTIAQKDWKIFSPYLSKPEEVELKTGNKDIFEDNDLKSYHLGLNEDAIKSRWPNLLFAKDYRAMISAMVEILDNKKDVLKLKKVAITHAEEKKTNIIFISHEDLEPGKIKDILFKLMNLYQENFPRFGVEAKSFVAKEFDPIYLSVHLQHSLESKDIKTKLKI